MNIKLITEKLKSPEYDFLKTDPQHFSQGAHDFSHWGEWRL